MTTIVERLTLRHLLKLNKTRNNSIKLQNDANIWNKPRGKLDRILADRRTEFEREKEKPRNVTKHSEIKM